jgi:hypothetical protein
VERPVRRFPGVATAVFRPTRNAPSTFNALLERALTAAARADALEAMQSVYISNHSPDIADEFQAQDTSGPSGTKAQGDQRVRHR